MGVTVRGQLPRGNHSGIIVWGMEGGGKSLRGNCPGGDFIRGNCPGGSCPVGIIQGQLSWGQKSRG